MSVTTRLRWASSFSVNVMGLSFARSGTFPAGQSFVSSAGSCFQSSWMSAARFSGVSTAATYLSPAAQSEAAANVPRANSDSIVFM